LHGAGPDWGSVFDDGATADSVEVAEAVTRLVALSAGVAVDVAAVVSGGCAALPPQPLSRRAAAAAVVRTSAYLIR
jgi:hypothetical protein